MGGIGGSVFHSIKGFRNAPTVSFGFHCWVCLILSEYDLMVM